MRGYSIALYKDRTAVITSLIAEALSLCWLIDQYIKSVSDQKFLVDHLAELWREFEEWKDEFGARDQHPSLVTFELARTDCDLRIRSDKLWSKLKVCNAPTNSQTDLVEEVLLIVDL